LYTSKRKVDADEAKRIGATLGIDWGKLDLDQFRRGLDVEFEHEQPDPERNVTNDGAVLTNKIAWAHLKEASNYCERLDRLETEANIYRASRR